MDERRTYGTIHDWLPDKLWPTVICQLPQVASAESAAAVVEALLGRASKAAVQVESAHL